MPSTRSQCRTSPYSHTIVIDCDTFNGLKKLSFESVENRGQAQKSAAEFTHIRKSGALFFSANGSGNGFGNGGQFADLRNGLNLTAQDIVLKRV